MKNIMLKNKNTSYKIACIFLGSIILIGVLNHLNLFYKKIMHLFKIPDRINLPTKIQGGI